MQQRKIVILFSLQPEIVVIGLKFSKNYFPTQIHTIFIVHVICLKKPKNNEILILNHMTHHYSKLIWRGPFLLIFMELPNVRLVILKKNSKESHIVSYYPQL